MEGEGGGGTLPQEGASEAQDEGGQLHGEEEEGAGKAGFGKEEVAEEEVGTLVLAGEDHRHYHHVG